MIRNVGNLFCWSSEKRVRSNQVQVVHGFGVKPTICRWYQILCGIKLCLLRKFAACACICPRPVVTYLVATPSTREKATYATYKLPGNLNNPSRFNTEGNDISVVDSVVDIDSPTTISWTSPSITQLCICRRAYARTYKIFKGFTTKNKDVLLKVFKTYVRSVLECGTTVFFPWKKRDIEAFEQIQNNFTRKLMIRYGGFFYQDLEL